MSFQHCRVEVSDKIISVTENKKKFQIRNPNSKTFNQIEVDGCLFSKGTAQERCDYLFESVEAGVISTVIYIELKGQNVKKAFKQLTATIKYCAEEHRGCTKECYIVASRIPKSGTDIRKMKIDLHRNCQASLTVKTNRAEYQCL